MRPRPSSGAFFFNTIKIAKMAIATSPPRLPTLILLTALSTLSLNMFLPSLANIARDLEAQYVLVSLAVGGYLAVTAVIQLIAGPLSDRLGRRPVLLAALAIFSLASVVCAVAQDIWTFLAFRMLQGAMISGYALSLAIIRDTAPEREAAGLMGYVSMAMAAAPMLGPMLGGVLDTAFGWRANFCVYALFGVGLLALCFFDLGETRPERPNAGTGEPETLLHLAREPRFWGYALCTACSTGAFYVFLAGAPLVAEATFEVSTAELGVFIGSITAGFMAGGFVASRLAPNYPLRTMMISGRLIACGGLAFGLAIVSLGWHNPVLFFGSTIFVGLGNGITMPSSNAGAMSVRPGLAGSAAGLNGALTVAGGAVLTTLTGALLTTTNAPYMLLSLMLATSCGGALSVLWVARLERSATSTPGET